MRAFGWIPVLVLLVPVARSAADEPVVDFSKPEAVLGAVFQAASGGAFGLLASLCDPMKENDGDTQRICDVANAAPGGQEEFSKWFKTGKITGEPTFDGDQAQIPFSFGPDGSKTETMNLIRRDGKWYLSSF